MVEDSQLIILYTILTHTGAFCQSFMFWKWCLIHMCSHRHWYIVQGGQENVTTLDEESFAACIVLHNAPCYWHMDLMENVVHFLLDRMESVLWMCLMILEWSVEIKLSPKYYWLWDGLYCMYVIVYNADILLITCAHIFTGLYISLFCPRGWNPDS